MVQKPVLVIEPEQQRSHLLSRRLVAETTHDAIGGAEVLDLEHDALAGPVWEIETFGNHAVDGHLADR